MDWCQALARHDDKAYIFNVRLQLPSSLWPEGVSTWLASLGGHDDPICFRPVVNENETLLELRDEIISILKQEFKNAGAGGNGILGVIIVTRTASGGGAVAPHTWTLMGAVK